MVKFSTVFIPLVPAFVTFGPLFIAISAGSKHESVWSVALIGGLMTGIGLAFIFVQVMKLRRAIEDLRATICNRSQGKKDS